MLDSEESLRLFCSFPFQDMMCAFVCADVLRVMVVLGVGLILVTPPLPSLDEAPQKPICLMRLHVVHWPVLCRPLTLWPAPTSSSQLPRRCRPCSLRLACPAAGRWRAHPCCHHRLRNGGPPSSYLWRQPR